MLVEHAHEAGIAALVRALRLPVLVGGCDEEHVPRLDERAVVVVDPVADDALLDPIGEASRVKAILELAAPFVIQRHDHDFFRESSRPANNRRQRISAAATCEGAAVGARPFSYVGSMGWHVADASKIEWGERPPAVEGQATRGYAEITEAAALQKSRGGVWRYPPGTRGRRHADKVQEEVFVVISGQMTMLLGEPYERVDVGPQSVVSVEPGHAAAGAKHGRRGARRSTSTARLPSKAAPTSSTTPATSSSSPRPRRASCSRS